MKTLWLLCLALAAGDCLAKHSNSISGGSRRRPRAIADTKPNLESLVDRSLVSKSLVSSTGQGQGAHLDKDVDYGRACLIVGYHKAGPNGSRIAQGNAYASNVFQHYSVQQNTARMAQGQVAYGRSQPVAPDVARVGNVQELMAAIQNCPKGSHLVLATHGYGDNGGGFWLGEPEKGEDPYQAGLVVSAGSKAFNDMVDALAARGIRNVTLHSCSIGQSAAHGELGDAGLTDPGVSDNFGNRLANAIYRKLDDANKTSTPTPLTRVTVFTKPIYGSTVAITAEEKETRRLAFEPDGPDVRRRNERRAANYPPPPQPIVQTPPAPPSPTQPVVQAPPAAPPSSNQTTTVSAPPAPPSTTLPLAAQTGMGNFTTPPGSVIGQPNFFSGLMGQGGQGSSSPSSSSSGSKKKGADKKAKGGAVVATPTFVSTSIAVPKPPEEAKLEAGFFVLTPPPPAAKPPAPEPLVVAPPIQGPTLDLRYWTADRQLK